MVIEQIRRNALALVSLMVAFAALGYNTWRNEQTEANRNVRQAGFEMLMHIGELQRITYVTHYDQDHELGNPRRGWVEVLVLRDLGQLVRRRHPLRVEPLYQAWKSQWDSLGEDEAAVEAIDAALDNLRQDVLATLKQLE